MRFLLLLFIVVPIVEMLVLIKVGGVIGAFPTIGLVCLTAIVGVWLIRRQGFAALQKAQLRMASGEMPAQEMMDGLCLAFGGAMLLTPGFVTDTFGFLLLTPLFRVYIMKAVLAKMFVGAGVFRSDSTPASTSSHDNRTTLEGEFRRED